MDLKLAKNHERRRARRCRRVQTVTNPAFTRTDKETIYVARVSFRSRPIGCYCDNNLQWISSAYCCLLPWILDSMWIECKKRTHLSWIPWWISTSPLMHVVYLDRPSSIHRFQAFESAGLKMECLKWEEGINKIYLAAVNRVKENFPEYIKNQHWTFNI